MKFSLSTTIPILKALPGITGLAVFFACVLTLASQTLSIDIEHLGSDDIQSQTSNIRFEQEDWEDFGIEIGWKQTEIDYKSAGFPIDITTNDTSRDEQEFSLATDATFQLFGLERVEFTPSFNYSEGFRSHTSIWLDEYYKQLWSGRTIGGDRYEDPTPSSFGIGMQFRWEYVVSNAFLSGGVSYASRTIAPGYDFEVEGERAGELVRGLSDLDTVNFNLSLENNMHRRWRMVNSLVASDTSGRDVRFTFEHQSFVALSEEWVVRSSVAHAREGSDFEANRVNFRLIRDIGFDWSVFLGAGYYSDNGEVEQANLATDAAPELESQHVLIGLQWSSFDQSRNLNVSIGQYDQTYESNQLDQRFNNLYSNRDWLLLKLSVSQSF